MSKILLFSLLFILTAGLQIQAEEKAEKWKDTYFKAHPEADLDQDGELSWQEYKAHKEAAAKKKLTEEEKLQADKFKNEYFKKFPEADKNKDGELSWMELKLHKASNQK